MAAVSLSKNIERCTVMRNLHHCSPNCPHRILGWKEEKDELVRQLEEAMAIEDANRTKIILKFKSRCVKTYINQVSYRPPRFGNTPRLQASYTTLIYVVGTIYAAVPS